MRDASYQVPGPPGYSTNVNYASSSSAWSGVPVKDTFAMRWTGILDIGDGGRYEFSTESDDGSVLYISSTKVVNNDGMHGMTVFCWEYYTYV